MRSRRDHAMLTFDLVEDVEDVPGGARPLAAGRSGDGDDVGRGADVRPSDAGPEPAAEPSALRLALLRAGRAFRRLARDPGRLLPRSRRVRVALAGGLVTVVAAVSVGVTVHQRAEQEAREALLSTAPGGVLSLDRAPVVGWSSSTYGADDLPVVVPGAIVAVNGNVVTAIDVATGRPRWEAEVPLGTECGPAPDAGAGPSAQVEAARPIDRVVCVTDGEEPSVTVLAADGTVLATRDLEPGPGTYHPAADGGLLYVERLLPAQDPVTVPGTTLSAVWTRLAEPLAEGGASVLAGWNEPARAVRIVMVDAVTGEPRWERPLGGRPWDPLLCADATASGTSTTIDGGVVDVTSTPTLVSVVACGAANVLSPDGMTLDRIDLPVARPDRHHVARENFSAQTFEPYADGGYVRRLRGAETLLDVEGNEVLTAWSGATLLNPLSTDGSRRDLILTSGGITMIGQDAAGTERWRVRAGRVLVVARTADAIVTALPDGTLSAYDPESGALVWTGPPISGDWAETFHASIVSAATDGETVLLALGPEPGPDGSAGLLTHDLPADEVMARRGTWLRPAGVRLVAVDVSSGQIRWEDARHGGLAPWLVGVDGHLVEVTRTEDLEETVDADGRFVPVRLGVVVGLG